MDLHQLQIFFLKKGRRKACGKEDFSGRAAFRTASQNRKITRAIRAPLCLNMSFCQGDSDYGRRKDVRIFRDRSVPENEAYA
ncbi:MAG: hypothetical protein ACI4P3_03610 [Candidatus Spyradosoma sp.]